jgi:DNA replication ATP-dependent helicase Dna2
VRESIMTRGSREQELLWSLERYLAREQQANDDELREIWSQPPAVRVDHGDALAVGAVLGWDDQHETLRVATDIATSRFRPGDELYLGSGLDPARGASLIYEQFEPETGVLRLALPRFGGDRAAIQRIVREGPPWMLDRAVVDTSELIRGAIANVFAASSPAAQAARKLLLAQSEVVVDPAQHAAAQESLQRLDARGLELARAQRQAFVQAWAASPLHLVQGPPGTGKTRLLALLVAALVWRGERILLTAFTHTAVDHALEALAAVGSEFGKPLRLYRFRPRSTSERLRPVGIESIGATHRLPGHGGLVCATTILSARAFCSSEPSARIGAAPFDRVVFDEAAQIPLPHALCALPCASRWVLFGDDAQLGPVIVADHLPTAPTESLFQRLAQWHRPTLLDETWRMNLELCQFPSRAFYSGQLQPAAPVASRRFQTRAAPNRRFEAVLGPDPPAVLVRFDHDACDRVSRDEAECAAALCAELLLVRGVAPEQMAVIAPFRRQNREITERLSQRVGTRVALPVIDTVERIQGQERELVIVSLTASDPDALRSDSRFFFSPERLNVALTRARTKLIVLASAQLLETLGSDAADLIALDRFHRLFAQLPQVLWSDLASQLDPA